MVERSARLAALLQQRFPGVDVVYGDAARLGELLHEHAGRITAAVSSLPLKSMPAAAVEAVVSGLARVLAPGATLTQYSYGHWPPRAWPTGCFVHRGSTMIWGNLPPARIDIYQRR